jgi:hypothetical protein
VSRGVDNYSVLACVFAPCLRQVECCKFVKLFCQYWVLGVLSISLFSKKMHYMVIFILTLVQVFWCKVVSMFLSSSKLWLFWIVKMLSVLKRHLRLRFISKQVNIVLYMLIHKETHLRYKQLIEIVLSWKFSLNCPVKKEL